MYDRSFSPFSHSILQEAWTSSKWGDRSGTPAYKDNTKTEIQQPMVFLAHQVTTIKSLIYEVKDFLGDAKNSFCMPEVTYKTHVLFLSPLATKKTISCKTVAQSNVQNMHTLKLSLTGCHTTLYYFNKSLRRYNSLLLFELILINILSYWVFSTVSFMWNRI